MKKGIVLVANLKSQWYCENLIYSIRKSGFECKRSRICVFHFNEWTSNGFGTILCGPRYRAFISEALYGDHEAHGSNATRSFNASYQNASH